MPVAQNFDCKRGSYPFLSDDSPDGRSQLKRIPQWLSNPGTDEGL